MSSVSEVTGGLGRQSLTLDKALRMRRGSAAPQTQARLVQVGALTVEVDGADVRSVRWGGTEVLQRIYMAVRDPVWNTVPGQLADFEVTERATSFEVRFTQHHQYGDIDVQWRGRIAGDAVGVLSYEMDAVALSDFRHAKIGLNLHHPLHTYVGRRYRTHTASSGNESGVLPELIAPQLLRDGTLTAMFDHFDAVSFDLDDVTVDFSFDGDWFEMQDHRNWSDANFKTYGTPLSFGFPIHVRAQERMYQRVVMTVRGAATPPAVLAEEFIWLEPTIAGRLPRIGHSVQGVCAGTDLELAQALVPHHVRADVRFEEKAPDLAGVSALASRLGARLELAAFLRTDQVEGDARAVAGLVTGQPVAVDRVIALTAASGFSEFRAATPPEVVLAVRDALRAAGSDVPVFGGTDQFFNEVNRARPDYSGVDGVAFSLNPQVHASDDRSLAQNTVTLPHIARSCRELLPGLAVAVTPVALVGADGPFPAGPRGAGQLADNVDVRLGALFGAAWAAAMLRSAAVAEVDSLTIFDLTGSRGVIADAATPTDFPAAPGSVLPPFHVLASLAAADGEVRATSSSNAPELDALAVSVAGSPLVVVYNLSPLLRSVRVGGLPGTAAKLRVLDETTLDIATADPAAFARSSSDMPLQDSQLHIALRPYAVAFIG